MIRSILLASMAMALASPAHAGQPADPRAVLVIHGGAGVIRRGALAEDEPQVRAALELALRRGYAEIKAGHPAPDAVTAAITVLEDDPHFNAGKGAVFTHDGRNELDSAIMDGATQQAGAIAGVHRIRNPILGARAVMEKSRHVMLVGEGAEAFAVEQGVALVDPAYFRTEKRWQQLQDALRADAAKGGNAEVETPASRARHFGTVGAVALDGQGHLAAGTSTGGMMDKRWGRVGDSPIIGAGTWADPRCGVSGTGWGEFYIRTAAASAVCARVKFLNESARDAGQAVINGDVVRMGGDGGAIVMTRDGRFAFPFSTDGMYRGWIGSDGVPHVAIYADEALAGDAVARRAPPAIPSR